MPITIEELREVTDEVVDAFAKLLPQLSSSAKPLDAAMIKDLVASSAVTVLLARDEGKIIGSLSLVVFRIPTGVRAWVEDVVVDTAAGRQGTGTALVTAAVERARAAGARTVDLTTRPARVAAGNLYERAGFTQRDTRVFRYSFE
ncbi:MAG TPA: GNAT family N-acetyltransferase [Streptosporangiaceae bacterium]